MGIRFKIKGINKQFDYNNSASWRGLIDYCPTLENIFPEKFVKEDNNYFPKRYLIKHTDKRLNQIQSEIDKYRENVKFVGDVVYILSGDIRKIIIQSKNKKKDLEVEVLWR